ncbi:MAG: hypothetical protein ACYCO5_11345, partial [Acidobacteriaceae bacterium]
LGCVPQFLAPGRSSYCAAEVVAALLRGLPLSAGRSSADARSFAHCSPSIEHPHCAELETV